jgi:hypothetical protein
MQTLLLILGLVAIGGDLTYTLWFHARKSGLNWRAR